MASIKRQPSGRYQARYRDATGREHAKRFDLKKDARSWLDGVTSAVQTGTYVDPKAGRSTVGALAPLWLQVKAGRVKPKTLYGYQGLLKTLVLPRWGDVAVSGITTADVEAWVSSLPHAVSRRHAPGRRTWCSAACWTRP